MKKTIVTVIISCIGLTVLANSDVQNKTVLASKNGLHLTQALLETAINIELILDEQTQLSPAERETVKASLIEEFNANPQETIDSILEVASDLGINSSNQNPIPTAPQPSKNKPQPSNLASGHAQLRQNVRTLGQRSGAHTAFADQAFDTPSVNQLRTFIANSQLSTSNYSDNSSSRRVFKFCADGTFSFYYESILQAAPTIGGGEVTGTKEANAYGYWDTYQENGNDTILLYSTGPEFIGESLNDTGLLPMPIAAYQQDVIQLGQRGQAPAPDMLLRRTVINNCY